MTAELVTIPGTGELIDLRGATLEQLAEARAYLTDLVHQKNAAAAALDEEITRRADEENRYGAAGQWTLAAGDYVVSVDRPSKRGTLTTTAAAALRIQLLQRAAELQLGRERIDAAFGVTYTAKTRELDNLASLAPAIKDLVDERRSPPKRNVRVERWRPPAIDTTAVDDTPQLEEPTW